MSESPDSSSINIIQRDGASRTHCKIDWSEHNIQNEENPHLCYKINLFYTLPVLTHLTLPGQSDGKISEVHMGHLLCQICALLF